MSNHRLDFPALEQEAYHKPLVYLDNAATTQKPLDVLQALRDSYIHKNANIHRGVHLLSREATEAHEEARRYVATFIGAASSDEIIFTRGTTEAINLVAATFCPTFMNKGDQMILSVMEHHSNIVPWQMAAERIGFEIIVIPILDNGTLDMEAYRQVLSERTKLVAICHASNVLGTVNPIAEMAEMAHDYGAKILVDGAQTIAHRPIDVQALGADFFAFSGHKVYAPTGIGVLYGRREILEALPPYQGGGEMIAHVSFEGTTYNDLPYKYEAGTPDFIGSVGLMAALKYVSAVGFDEIMNHEYDLLHYATDLLKEQIEGLHVYGEAPNKEAVLSFLINGVHPYDLGTLLDRQGIALRTGHHCAQPLMHHLGVEGTLRASFALYNSREEVDLFLSALKRSLAMLR